MSQKESFGMMDQGYFVPRTEIIQWLNDLLSLNITKIQQLGSGAVYCQVVDVIYPGKVAMNKVNWKAKNSYEFTSNLKILQNAFEKIGIKRYVQVERLAKAKYQDNLEFIQWLKRFFDKNCGAKGSDYNAEERRGVSNPDFGFAAKIIVPKTYNGSGQIIPGNKIIAEQKPKKKEQGLKQIKENNNKVASKTTADRKPTQKIDMNKVKNEAKRSEEYEKRVKELQMKMGMILEVVNSEQTSDMKIGMVKQILECDEKEKNESKQQNMYYESESQEQVII